MNLSILPRIIAKSPASGYNYAKHPVRLVVLVPKSPASGYNCKCLTNDVVTLV